MLNKQIARISKQLKSAFAERTLEQLGREARFEKRTARVITTFGFCPIPAVVVVCVKKMVLWGGLGAFRPRAFPEILLVVLDD